MTSLHLTLRNAAPIAEDVRAMLAGASSAATPVQHIILRDLIARAAALHADIEALQLAMAAESHHAPL